MTLNFTFDIPDEQLPPQLIVDLKDVYKTIQGKDILEADNHIKNEVFRLKNHYSMEIHYSYGRVL